MNNDTTKIYDLSTYKVPEGVYKEGPYKELSRSYETDYAPYPKSYPIVKLTQKSDIGVVRFLAKSGPSSLEALTKEVNLILSKKRTLSLPSDRESSFFLP